MGCFEKKMDVMERCAWPLVKTSGYKMADVIRSLSNNYVFCRCGRARQQQDWSERLRVNSLLFNELIHSISLITDAVEVVGEDDNNGKKDIYTWEETTVWADALKKEYYLGTSATLY